MKVLALILTFIGQMAVADNSTVVLTTKNTVTMRGVIDDTLVSDTQAQIQTLVNERGGNDYTIYLVLDSPGGSIESGLSFIEYAKKIKNLQTISIFAASMASAIVEALPGDRLVLGSGTLMFHRAAGAFEGYFEVGEVESRLWYAKSMVLRMEKTNYQRMQMNREAYKNLVQSELWLYSDESISYRAADRIVDIVCTRQLIDKTTSIAVMDLISLITGAGATTMSFSACPLFRTPTTISDEKATYHVPSAKGYRAAMSLRKNK